MNLAIVNSTNAVNEGDGFAEICISIDAVIERPITVMVNAMSITAMGMYALCFMCSLNLQCCMLKSSQHEYSIT